MGKTTGLGGSDRRRIRRAFSQCSHRLSYV